MPDIQATGQPILPADQEGKDGDQTYDDAQNWFTADSLFLVADSNNTWIAVTKYDAAGNVVGTWRVLPTATYKFDGTPALSHKGTELVVRSYAHTYTPPGQPTVPRRSKPLVGRIPGVYVVGSAPPPPPPPVGGDIVLPDVVAGRYRRV